MFELRVQFGMPWKERVEINTKISPNVPFTARASDKEGHTYNIGGTLLPRKKGKYRLVLTTVNWEELGESVRTIIPEMELNKTLTLCSIDGIGHNCIATTLLAAKNE